MDTREVSSRTADESCDGHQAMLPLFVPARFRDEWLPRLNGSTLSVFLAYLSRANKKGIAFPSLGCLCRDTGFGINAVKRGRKQCVELGLLTPVKGATESGADKKWKQQEKSADGKLGRKEFAVKTEF
jgi:hypothetical protein